MHNTFIAAGPDFRRELVSDLPTANTDVAVTIMHLLGVTPSTPLDGRVVTEALRTADAPEAKVESSTVEAARDLPAGKWQQQLRTSKVGSSVYIDEGNGKFTPREAQ
jgi:hypothetical protein